ncbi:lysine--tRNA ligase, partial [Nonomuraea sp. NPDC055795]
MTTRWRWVPKVLAGILAALAVYCALIALVRPLRALLRPVTDTFNDLVFPAEPNLAYAVFLALLAGAVARRKRAAYRLMLVFLIFTLVLLALYWLIVWLEPAAGEDYPLWRVAVNLGVTLVLLVLLVAARAEFFAKTQRAAFRKALLALVAGLLVSVGVGYALISAFHGTLRRQDRLPWVIEKALGGAITLDFDREGYGPAWVAFTIGLLSAIALLWAFAVLFRSQWAIAELLPGDEARLRALLAAEGERDSLGYFATRRDRAAIFSPSGKSAVSYRVVSGVLPLFLTEWGGWPDVTWMR